MLCALHLQSAASLDHGRSQRIGLRPFQTVFHARIRQRFDHQKDKGRSTSAQRSRDGKLVGVHKDQLCAWRKQIVDELQLLLAQRMGLFADDHTVSRRDRCIGDHGQMCAARHQHALQAGERHACCHREDELFFQLFPDRGQHVLELIRLYGQDHHITGRDDL